MNSELERKTIDAITNEFIKIRESLKVTFKINNIHKKDKLYCDEHIIYQSCSDVKNQQNKPKISFLEDFLLVKGAPMVLYWGVAMMAIEISIGQMSFYDSLKTRGVASVVNLLTALPYDRYKQFIFKKSGIIKESKIVKKYAGNCLAYTTFQTPVYIGILGATSLIANTAYESEHILNGIITLIFCGASLSMAYDKFQNWYECKYSDYKKKFGKRMAEAYETLHEKAEPEKKIIRERKYHVINNHSM